MITKKLTIVTPTYNRRMTLSKVYKSLLSQSSHDFVWMIIDDGSIDDTKELVERFKKNKKFMIIYYYKKNGGKASALNYALDRIRTEYFCCLDSDDYLTDDAVKIALSLLDEEIDNNSCCGLLALRNDKDGNVLGGKEIPERLTYTTVGELYSRVDNTELLCFYKYNFVGKIRFPIVPGESFVSPTWFQFKATENNKFRTTRERLCVCEYLSDGITKNKKKIIVKNPNGYTLMKKESLKNSKNIFKTIRHAIMYDCGCIIGKNKKWLKESPKKIISFVCYPFGYLVYMRRFKPIIDKGAK